MNTMEKRCYTVKEIGQILNISRTSVYRLLEENHFSWKKVLGEYRISKRSFDAWFDGDLEEDEE